MSCDSRIERSIPPYCGRELVVIRIQPIKIQCPTPKRAWQHVLVVMSAAASRWGSVMLAAGAGNHIAYNKVHKLSVYSSLRDGSAGGVYDDPSCLQLSKTRRSSSKCREYQLSAMILKEKRQGRTGGWPYGHDIACLLPPEDPDRLR